jgi:prephenate dehydratase
MKITSATDTPLSAPVDTDSPLKVAIQGYAGAFHEIASRTFYADRSVQIVPAHSFEDVVNSLLDGTADSGLMAIENTLAGSLMANYELLQSNDLRISGEAFLRIEQNLLVLPGTRIEDLREVRSHPIALAQCHKFFRQYPQIKLIEDIDTALSARQVAELEDPTIGAVASTLASDLYGLEILAAGIETNKKNHTRFLVLEPGAYQGQNQGDKVSLSFAVSHTSGSLYRVLAVLAAYHINLTKIQSTPIIGMPWEYRFFVDFVAEGDLSWNQALEAIRPITHGLRVLGVYPQGDKPDDV